MSAHNQNSQSGFTLVEVLIAMFIFSLISVGTMSALTTAISGKEQIETRLEALAQLESARALIKSDMANVILRSGRDEYGGNNLYVFSGGVDALVDFTRAGRDNPGGLQARGDLQRVSYVFENGSLIRRARGHENPSAITPFFDRELLSGLVYADVQFIVENRRETTVFISPDDTELPDIIQIEAEFENGDVLTQYFEIGL